MRMKILVLLPKENLNTGVSTSYFMPYIPTIPHLHVLITVSIASTLKKDSYMKLKQELDSI